MIPGVVFSPADVSLPIVTALDWGVKSEELQK